MGLSNTSDILDYCITLMEGTASGVDRSLPAGHFIHTQEDVSECYNLSVERPYPFSFVVPGTSIGEPTEGQITGSAGLQVRQVDFTIEVGYTAMPQESYSRLTEMSDDISDVLRTLRNQQSWSVGLSVFEQVRVEGADISNADVGTQGDDVMLMHVVTIPIMIRFWEDHS